MELELLLYLALVPMLGVTAQWLAWFTNFPGILLLLIFGVVLGQYLEPDAYLMTLTGGDESAGPNLLFPLVSLAVAVIMFEGGLSLKFNELREAGGATLRLCTLGAAITFVLAAVAAKYILGFEWQLSFLLGGILTVTGPTVIGPLLRQVRPTKRVASTLKWEGIVIDPVGAVLAVLVFEQAMLHSGDAGIGSTLLMFAKTVAVGVGLGALGGALMTLAFRKFWVPDNLHGVGALSVGLLLFAISDALAHESGLITVTVLGIWLTNQDHFDVEHIVEFKENLRTLLIGCLFIVLGSRVQLENVAAIGVPGLFFLVVLILLIRPISVFVSLIGSPLNQNEKMFIAGLAPRGIVAAAVSSVFALHMQRHPEITIPGAEQLATVTFLVIVGTVAVYGLAAVPLARWLGLADRSTNGVLIAGADKWVCDFALELTKADLPVLLVDSNFTKISNARVAGLEAVCANILNEHAREELQLTGIGKLMAMTQNDEVNTLAVRECRHMFGRANVFQLTFNPQNTHHRRGLTKNLMGRELFGKANTFTEMRELHESGAKFKSTTLSKEFGADEFHQEYGATAVLLCAINEDGTSMFDAVDEPLKLKAGQRIVFLVKDEPVDESTDETPRE